MPNLNNMQVEESFNFPSNQTTEPVTYFRSTSEFSIFLKLMPRIKLNSTFLNKNQQFVQYVTFTVYSVILPEITRTPVSTNYSSSKPLVLAQGTWSTVTLQKDIFQLWYQISIKTLLIINQSPPSTRLEHKR